MPVRLMLLGCLARDLRSRTVVLTLSAVPCPRLKTQSSIQPEFEACPFRMSYQSFCPLVHGSICASCMLACVLCRRASAVQLFLSVSGVGVSLSLDKPCHRDQRVDDRLKRKRQETTSRCPFSQDCKMQEKERTCATNRISYLGNHGNDGGQQHPANTLRTFCLYLFLESTRLCPLSALVPPVSSRSLDLQWD